MGYEKSTEKKAKNGKEVFQEMIPFLFYAAVPLIITVILALTFGPSH